MLSDRGATEIGVFAMIDDMRSGFSILLIVAVMFAGGYFYHIAQAVCPTPLSYTIGELDERFGLSYNEAQVAVTEASEVWENATDRNLFSYDADAEFTINFIFDERQAFTEAESEFKEKLDAAEHINDAISDTYAKLVAQYNTLRIAYADKVEAYERRLSVYNDTVEKYNNQGGAPPDAFEELKQEKKELDDEQYALNNIADKLNGLVKEINSMSEKGNSLVQNYNQGVGVYNKTFGETREFTQGDYQGDRINIYTYEDKDELKLVLTHELGHALSLGHVDGESSVMYYLIGEQPRSLELSQADKAEFARVCGDLSVWDKIQLRLQSN